MHLKGLTNLQSLYLNAFVSKVTDAGLVDLKELANLQYLLLGEAKITDSGIVELQKTLPNCEIIR